MIVEDGSSQIVLRPLPSLAEVLHEKMKLSRLRSFAVMTI